MVCECEENVTDWNTQWLQQSFLFFFLLKHSLISISTQQYILPVHLCEAATTNQQNCLAYVVLYKLFNNLYNFFTYFDFHCSVGQLFFFFFSKNFFLKYCYLHSLRLQGILAVLQNNQDASIKKQNNFMLWKTHSSKLENSNHGVWKTITAKISQKWVERIFEWLQHVCSRH